jgi:hypothetical protein
MVNVIQLDSKGLNEIIAGTNQFFHLRPHVFVSDDGIKISSLSFYDDIELSRGADSRKEIITFEDCVFHKNFIFTNFSGINSVCLNNCIFKEDFGMIEVRNLLKIENNCIFNKSAFIKFNNGDFDVSNSQFANLTISGTINHLKFASINQSMPPDIVDPILLFKNLVLIHSNLIKIKFHKILIQDKTRLDYEGNFIEVECTELSLNNIFIGHLVHIMASNIKRFFIDNIGILDSNYPHRFLKFSTNCSFGLASIPISMLESIEITESKFDTLDFSAKNKPESILRVTYCTLNCLRFGNVVNKANIILSDLVIENNGIFSIINSDLGKADFIRCSFQHATMVFQSSKIMDLFLAETDFPKIVKNNNIKDYKQARLAFGQLQTAFQKQGDSVRSLEYHSREVEAHFKTVWNQPKQFFTSLNLFLNWISNNFGRWWVLGIIFTSSMGVLFFFLLLSNTNRPDLASQFLNDVYLTESFLKFMNPLRHFDINSVFEKEQEISAASPRYFYIDFFARVVIAFGYYQTIQAFRKYGRK